ncbi:MAG: UbiA family prenyltransferase [Verrucomicrobiales bacterium]|nr:UbiA family prenyltransferase [Verrucomicrobiales bacterium]
MAAGFARRVRTFLTLGRVSNLPTVWSNCLAGWWLGGGGAPELLVWLLGGVSLLYLGGMFLNDAFDAEFDRRHRRERPIPAGEISERAVWALGWGLLATGAGMLFGCGSASGWLGLALAGSIVLYDAVHKVVTVAPLLMGLCRFWVYVVAAASAREGVNGHAVWAGLALAGYVTGLSFLARHERMGGPVPRWPTGLLATPIVLALLMNRGPHLEPALWLSLILGLWVIRCVRRSFGSSHPNVPLTVSGLLAGMVLVDWLSVAPEATRELSLIFLGLFAGAWLAQRLVPAT